MNMMSDPNAARKDWLGLLAKSPADEVARLWAALPIKPEQ
jgi:alpha-D-ribose 1-methylphosphonate 5-triphosphate synthase subunit PhnG